MRLNPDCVRDVMLFLEDNLSINVDRGRYTFMAVTPVNILSDDDLRVTHSKEDIIYSVFQLIQDEYIVAKGGPTYDKYHFDMNIGEILFITPKGHNFISTISDKGIWDHKIMPILQKIGSVSVSVIAEVAASLIKQHMGLSF